MSRISANGASVSYHQRLLGITSSEEVGDSVTVGQGVQAQPYETGLITGGVLTVNGSDDSTFDISAGTARIVDNYTDPTNPVVTELSWPAQAGVAATYIATTQVSRVCIDPNGDILQIDRQFTDEDYRDCIVLGALVHANFTNITATNMTPFVPIGQFELFQFIRMFGGQNRQGNEFLANGANLQLDKASGNHWILGGEYDDTPAGHKNPNNGSDILQSPVPVFFETYDSGDGESLVADIRTGPATLRANAYDDGTGTLNTGSMTGNQSSLRYVYYFPSTGLMAVRMGTTVYSSLAAAIAGAVDTKPFVTADYTAAGYLRTIIAIRRDCTDLTDTATADFIQIDDVRTTPYE